MTAKSLGIIGARGYVGRELAALVAAHPGFDLACMSSRALAGRKVADDVAGAPADLVYEELSPEAVATRGLDACVLALPNGAAAPYVATLEAARPETLIVDLSADYRFDGGWVYGLPELNRADIPASRRISNPGCYATAMMLALLPLRGVLAAPPACFGVSGYSGAGTTPSRKNDTEALRDNLMPYALQGHKHEQEVSRHLGRAVHFMPHVAAYFRGIVMTADLTLERPISKIEAVNLYKAHYADEPLVGIIEDRLPEARDGQGRHGCLLGGFEVDEDGRRLVVVSVLDNLLKGAATQALQNLNLASGLPELEGIPL